MGSRRWFEKTQSRKVLLSDLQDAFLSQKFQKDTTEKVMGHKELEILFFVLTSSPRAIQYSIAWYAGKVPVSFLRKAGNKIRNSLIVVQHITLFHLHFLEVHYKVYWILSLYHVLFIRKARVLFNLLPSKIFKND